MPEFANPARSHGLVDILDRVLDKGLVIAGDIKVNLANVELLTIQVRLLVCSIDKAEQIGLDWWKYDRHLSPGREEVLQENLALRRELRQLEQPFEGTGRPIDRDALAADRAFHRSPRRVNAASARRSRASAVAPPDRFRRAP